MEHLVYEAWFIIKPAFAHEAPFDVNAFDAVFHGLGLKSKSVEFTTDPDKEPLALIEAQLYRTFWGIPTDIIEWVENTMDRISNRGYSVTHAKVSIHTDPAEKDLPVADNAYYETYFYTVNVSGISICNPALTVEAIAGLHHMHLHASVQGYSGGIPCYRFVYRGTKCTKAEFFATGDTVANLLPTHNFKVIRRIDSYVVYDSDPSIYRLWIS